MDYLSDLIGDDSIWGAWGDDTLLGGHDNDYLSGGSKNDYINGGHDNDTLVGGNNADTIDTILDFNSNEGDMIKIDMSGYGISSLNNVSFNSATGELSV
ncbi:MAG: calcium-binding protein, partial [Okeania sp. SIO2F4]|uniref:calcium-binding protein n=1 Tax=Okeania sp. SIO2F4 TaxID=2607790 RepID=UPI0014299D42|nr:calcium-binding protein [Okeania sp. SIO2F4]